MVWPGRSNERCEAEALCFRSRRESDELTPYQCVAHASLVTISILNCPIVLMFSFLSLHSEAVVTEKLKFGLVEVYIYKTNSTPKTQQDI